MDNDGGIAFTLNGRATVLHVDGDRRLLDVLRNDLDLKGSHYGCGSGECGACFVLLDEHAVPACDTPIWAVAGKRVVTAEGLGTPEHPHPLQTAFVAEQAAQCGYCTSGMLIAGAALLHRCPHPSDTEIRAGMERNLCRCGVHLRVMRAVRRAAQAARYEQKMDPEASHNDQNAAPETSHDDKKLAPGASRDNKKVNQ